MVMKENINYKSDSASQFYLCGRDSDKGHEESH